MPKYFLNDPKSIYQNAMQLLPYTFVVYDGHLAQLCISLGMNYCF